MTEAVERFKPQLERLSPPERAELAHFLLASLDPEEDEGAATAWDAEAAERLEEIRADRAIGKFADRLFSELRDRYP